MIWGIIFLGELAPSAQKIAQLALPIIFVLLVRLGTTWIPMSAPIVQRKAA